MYGITLVACRLRSDFEYAIHVYWKCDRYFLIILRVIWDEIDFCISYQVAISGKTSFTLQNVNIYNFLIVLTCVIDLSLTAWNRSVIFNDDIHHWIIDSIVRVIFIASFFSFIFFLFLFFIFILIV